MSFEPVNELERSLVKAAADAAHRPQFYRDFAAADIYIIQHGVRPPEREGHRTLTEGETIQIQHIELNGKSCIPIFSSLERLQAVLTSEAAYLAMNAREFLAMTKGAALVLNPGSDYGKEITAEEAASIVDGSIWQPSERYVAQAPTQVMIGQPKNYPTELVDALARLFKTKKEVKRAWVAHFFNPQRDEKPHTLIAIEASGNFDAVVADAGVVASNITVPDPPVDFMQLTADSGIEDYFSKGSVKPFYQRRLLGLF